MHATAANADDLKALPGNIPAGLEDFMPRSDPYADQTKWPAWKVTIALVVFCGAFWAGIGYLIYRLVS
jgi:hypothetical protein